MAFAEAVTVVALSVVLAERWRHWPVWILLALVDLFYGAGLVWLVFARP